MPLTVTITGALFAITCWATAPHAAPVTSVLFAPHVQLSFSTLPQKMRLVSGDVPTCSFFMVKIPIFL